jgi:hypothetical protein
MTGKEPRSRPRKAIFALSGALTSSKKVNWEPLSALSFFFFSLSWLAHDHHPDAYILVDPVFTGVPTLQQGPEQGLVAP